MLDKQVERHFPLHCCRWKVIVFFTFFFLHLLFPLFAFDVLTHLSILSFFHLPSEPNEDELLSSQFPFLSYETEKKK